MAKKRIRSVGLFRCIVRKSRNIFFVGLIAALLFILHESRHGISERLEEKSTILRREGLQRKSSFEINFESRDEFRSRSPEAARRLSMFYRPNSVTTLPSLQTENKDSLEEVITSTRSTLPKTTKRRLAKKRKTVGSTKTSHLATSSTTSRHIRVSSKTWLNAYTPNIPLQLLELLQSILTRDYEKSSGSEVTRTEGTDASGRCKRGYFRLRGMEKCQKWLQCKEIAELTISKVLGNGVGKIINKARWKDTYDVALVRLREDRMAYKMFVGRVQSGVDNIMMAQPSPYVTQVIGFCSHGNNTVLVMEGCEYGNFRQFYTGADFRRLPVIEKFKIAIQMVAEMDYLHRGFDLPRINCDVHNPTQAFGQYLVSSDRRLFLNDMDELPVVDRKNNKMADCEAEPFGVMSMPEFLAPEIHYTPKEHELRKWRKPVDEKSDVWKIPDLIWNIMTSVKGTRSFGYYERNVQYHLKGYLNSIHQRCKIKDPKRRPTARDVLIVYLEVYKKLLSGEYQAI